ncbi:hypothetical protein TNCV_2649451 [Trichonephila clavipes]|nr:hypothetical protein TNCV_2649451 [Trichonephila clavipes]
MTKQDLREHDIWNKNELCAAAAEKLRIEFGEREAPGNVPGQPMMPSGMDPSRQGTMPNKKLVKHGKIKKLF